MHCCQLACTHHTHTDTAPAHITRTQTQPHHTASKYDHHHRPLPSKPVALRRVRSPGEGLLRQQYFRASQHLEGRMGTGEPDVPAHSPQAPDGKCERPVAHTIHRPGRPCRIRCMQQSGGPVQGRPGRWMVCATGLSHVPSGGCGE